MLANRRFVAAGISVSALSIGDGREQDKLVQIPRQLASFYALQPVSIPANSNLTIQSRSEDFGVLLPLLFSYLATNFTNQVSNSLSSFSCKKPPFDIM